MNTSIQNVLKDQVYLFGCLGCHWTVHRSYCVIRYIAFYDIGLPSLFINKNPLGKIILLFIDIFIMWGKLFTDFAAFISHVKIKANY